MSSNDNNIGRTPDNSRTVSINPRRAGKSLLSERMKNEWAEKMAESHALAIDSNLADALTATNSRTTTIKSHNPTTLDLSSFDNLNDDLATEWVKHAVSQLINEYRTLYQRNRGDNLGIFVDPNSMIESFNLRSESDPDDVTGMVKFGLDPYPFFSRDDFEGYSINLYATTKDDGAVNDAKAEVHLYGVNILPGEEFEHDRYRLGNKPLLNFSNLSIGDYHYDPNWQAEVFAAAAEQGELWWHRAVFQSIMFHANNGDPVTKPMKAFMQVARPNSVPDKQEFLNAIDKVKLVEGLE